MRSAPRCVQFRDLGEAFSSKRVDPLDGGASGDVGVEKLEIVGGEDEPRAFLSA